jgi:hypothetical protein
MADEDFISLRPRITIFRDLHPELFEMFSQTPVSRHNALAMSLLVRMATIHQLGILSSGQLHNQQRVNPVASEVPEHQYGGSERRSKPRKPTTSNQPQETPKLNGGPSIEESSIDSGALRDALGGLGIP